MRHSRWPVAAGDQDFAPYLTGRPDGSVQMFWRFIELARASGPLTFELQNGPVVLCGTRRIFASVRVTASGLRGHLNLTRHLADRRITDAHDATKSLVFHRYVIRCIADLDGEFGQWLAQARDVGDGAHLDG